MEEVFDIFLHGPLSLSSHYLIADDGTVYRLVSENHRAWHSGQSLWDGQPDVNNRSIGIELRNGGCLTPAGDANGACYRTAQGRLYRPLNPVVVARDRHWESYAEAQVKSLVTLCGEISQRHAIPPINVVGHDQVAVPPGRKIDPGPLFDWERLRRETDFPS